MRRAVVVVFVLSLLILIPSQVSAAVSDSNARTASAAKSFSLVENQTVKGKIENWNQDWYKFSLNHGTRFKINAINASHRFEVKIYSSGSTAKHRIYSNSLDDDSFSTVVRGVDTIYLKRGTYYLMVTTHNANDSYAMKFTNIRQWSNYTEPSQPSTAAVPMRNGLTYKFIVSNKGGDVSWKTCGTTFYMNMRKGVSYYLTARYVEAYQKDAFTNLIVNGQYVELRPGATYHRKMYATTNGNRYFKTDWSQNSKGLYSIKVTAQPSQVRQIKAKKVGKKKVKISWSRVPDANGYILYRATKKKGTYKIVNRIPSNRITSVVKKQKKGKKYYYRVRTYKVVDGYTMYGNMSKILKKKIK